MIEDKLTRDERIRLESLAQAVASSGMHQEGTETIIHKAKRFETYIRSEEES